jgi:tRNA nucleotidyltransferase (CCA-adding enzyme)
MNSWLCDTIFTMHVILTHEQTDFDALASLFAAALLFEGAIPVLPRRLNRNVRSFVTLYGLEFNFLDPRDLPSEGVEAVTLVDTQSLVTLKGMGAGTNVCVIDHHPLRPDLPTNWQVSIDEVGATTTILVEGLQVQAERLAPIQATLLLTGIYEDTGSLAYAHTTARDMRAAAWLIDQGASLQIAIEFLNPPLSEGQRILYDQLLEAAETFHIHGYRIIIACGDASEAEEEISTLAHKLHDLLDPDALFILVTTQGGIRLVARSSTDAIDVSEITAVFGGGGHDRAAAALIRDEQKKKSPSLLKLSCGRLVDELHSRIRPSVTVGEIMSTGAQVLNLDTSVKEAAKLMQRSGFEGYPVVDSGVVVGLLTRRAVDRALAHKLNLTASSLMEAGSVIVTPADSLQSLQDRMTDSGWGQIPVVNDNGTVIGIVTRTDLLKTLTLPKKHKGENNLAAKLEAALPVSRLELIKKVASQALARKMAVYIVGGFVRDLLLDHPSLDFDIVVEGDAIELGKSMAKKFGGLIKSHARFGTAKWYLSDQNRDTPLPGFLDLISARSEFYEHPTALPTVERGGIKLDLHRRDFTINTLALRLDGSHYGELHDYWGGMADLERGLVRVLHSLSFVDDPTRMLRAVKYEQRYGFIIEARTRELMEQASPLLEKLSPERVRHELDLILDEPKLVPMLSRLSELELLSAIHPSLRYQAAWFKGNDLPIPEAFSSIRSSAIQPMSRTLNWLLWMQHLDLKEIKILSRRLRFPAALNRLCIHAARLLLKLPSLAGANPSNWVDRLSEVPELAIYSVYLGAGKKDRQNILKYMSNWQNVRPFADGNDLKTKGIPPGPVYQNVLHDLRNAWLDGEITTRKGELELLERLLKENNK